MSEEQEIERLVNEINMNIKYLHDPLKKINENCVEQMVLHAALLLNENDLYEELLDDLRKAYVHLIPKGDSDIQIDIYYCVRFYGSTRRKYWGADETRLSEGLKSLEKRIYFLRTGTNGGPGHYQLLYYSEGKWRIYSSPTNYYEVTDGQGNLTEVGKGRLLSKNAKWGPYQGQYEYTITSFDKDILKPLIRHIINIRLHGDIKAMELFKYSESYQD